MALAAPGARDRVAPATRDQVGLVGLVSRADQVMDTAAVGRGAPAVPTLAVPEGPRRADRADTAQADPAARGRMVQVLKAQGLRGRAAQVLNPGQALPDLTPTVPARAHLDRTPAVPDLMRAHLDRLCPAGLGPTRRRLVAAAMPREAETRPAGRTLRLVATPRAGATPPAEVTDLRP